MAHAATEIAARWSWYRLAAKLGEGEQAARCLVEFRSRGRRYACSWLVTKLAHGARRASWSLVSARAPSLRLSTSAIRGCAASQCVQGDCRAVSALQYLHCLLDSRSVGYAQRRTVPAKNQNREKEGPNTCNLPPAIKCFACSLQKHRSIQRLQ